MRIELEALIGPNDATCAQVLKRMLRYPPYDILHYSGHCGYVKDDPPSSGWLFGDGLRLSANELSRVDRVPAFVFSNACESGVTPSRPDLRTPRTRTQLRGILFRTRREKLRVYRIPGGG